MKKQLENFDKRSRFEQGLINLILSANDENLERLRKAYPELVKEFRE